MRGCHSISELFSFLENFEITNKIRILDSEANVLFEGEMGDVPQKITNMMSVIRGTAIWKGEYLEVKVKKC